MHIRALSKSQQDLRVIAQNSYTNLIFSLNLDFYKNKNDDDDDEKEKEEILWIMIVAIGIMIIGLIPLVKQQCKLKEEAMEENKQTMLTTDDDSRMATSISTDHLLSRSLWARVWSPPNTIS